jgi:hypothetical protein
MVEALLFQKQSHNYERSKELFIIKIHRARIDRLVKLNGLREVTDLNLMDKGMPTPRGLFGNEIFGFSQQDRRSIPAYIDLKGHYLHPLTFNNLKSLNRKYESLIMGTKYYRFLDDGSIEEDPKGGTGIDFLYANWDKVKLKDTQSVFGTQRIQSVMNKETAWVDKWFVLPAFFRDLNFNEEGRPSYDAINEKYVSILRMVASVSQQSQYGFVSNITKARIQLLINEIHDEIVDKHMQAKHGTFKRYVMSKSVDFGARLVISAPRIQGERFTDMQVRFNQMGIPLSTMCSVFFPFVVYGIREFFQNEFVHGGKYGYEDPKTGEIKYTTLIHPESTFSDEYIIKMIKKFIFGTSTRFETIDIPENTDGLKLKMKIDGRFGKENTNIKRDMTWADILFIVSTDILSDKHIYATRYPIEDNFGISPSKVSIMSTKETMPAIIGDKVYKFYPIINPDQPSDRQFVDTLNLPLAYLIGYGADFDGDMMSVTGVFTNEANEDAERQTKDKKNILTITTENIRAAQRDFVQTYYSLTKRPKVDNLPEFKNLSRVVSFK